MTKTKTLLLLSFAFFILSCKKSNVENTAQDPVLKKKVELFDEGTQKIDNSGIKVSVENSNPLISTVTNEQGEFTLSLKNAPQSFAVIFEKQGMGTYKSYFKRSENGDLYELNNDLQYRFVNTAQPYLLGSKSTVTVNNIHAEIVGGKIKLQLNVSANSPSQKYVRILIQKDLPGLSLNTVSQTVKNVASILEVHDGDNSFEFHLNGFMYCHEYVTGDKIYMTAYGDALGSNWYTDMATGQWKFPNLKFVENNPVTSFVIP
jgi:hypothetical protein